MSLCATAGLINVILIVNNGAPWHRGVRYTVSVSIVGFGLFMRFVDKKKKIEKSMFDQEMCPHFCFCA